jgi:hypothetical protein
MSESFGKDIRTSEADRLNGIAGWLALALAVLIIQAIAVVWMIVSPFFSSPATTTENMAGALIYCLLLGFLLYVIVSFWREKRRTRILVMMFYGATLLLASAGLAFLPHGETDVLAYIRTIVLSLIWIAYFSRSRRVRNTLVN